MAGATLPQLRQREHATESMLQHAQSEMIKAIRTPVQRNTFYEPIKVCDAAPTATQAEPPSGKSKVLEDNWRRREADPNGVPGHLRKR